jgi:hypothetical protein
MIALMERRTLGERYADPAASRDLGVHAGGCDADVLLAAGFAAQGKAAGSLALSLWRMRQMHELGGFAAMNEISVNWLIGRPNGRTRLARRMRRVEALDLAAIVLSWWLHNPA